MNNLKTIQRGFFESKLAELVLKNPTVVPAVSSVSKHIVNLMKLNKEEMLQAIGKSFGKVSRDLYDKSMFGRLAAKKELTAEVIFEDMVTTMKSGKDLAQVMHCHSCFFYRLAPSLTKNLKRELSSSSSEKSLSEKYSQMYQNNPKQARSEVSILCSHKHKVIQDRGRKDITDYERKVEQEKMGSKKATYSRLGYALPSFFSKQLSPSSAHAPGGLKFKKDKSSHYVSLVERSDQVFVAGVSGHTLSYIKGVLLFGQLDKDALKEYGLGVFAYLAGGGNHSFIEVMTVMKTILNTPYEINQYTPSLPESLLSSTAFSGDGYNFKRRYSQFLDASPAQPYINKHWSRFFNEKAGVDTREVGKTSQLIKQFEGERTEKAEEAKHTFKY